MTMRGIAGVGVVVMATIALTPVPAQSTTYRYWSYWNGGDQWTYSSRGPAFQVTPADGVEGWRFVVSPKDGSQATAPASPSSYQQLCPGQPSPPAGKKRVAVVIDSGPSGIAPVGETPPPLSVTCLTAPTAETGLQVLQRVARLRFHPSGLICGIAGFPASECPGQSAAQQATTSPRPSLTPRSGSTAPAPEVQQTSPDERPTAKQSSAPSDTSSSQAAPSEAPSAVAMELPETPAPTNQPQVPPWVAAIGATMIAVLLGLALAIRRGRT